MRLCLAKESEGEMKTLWSVVPGPGRACSRRGDLKDRRSVGIVMVVAIVFALLAGTAPAYAHAYKGETTVPRISYKGPTQLVISWKNKTSAKNNKSFVVQLRKKGVYKTIAITTKLSLTISNPSQAYLVTHKWGVIGGEDYLTRGWAFRVIPRDKYRKWSKHPPNTVYIDSPPSLVLKNAFVSPHNWWWPGGFRDQPTYPHGEAFVYFEKSAAWLPVQVEARDSHGALVNSACVKLPAGTDYARFAPPGHPSMYPGEEAPWWEPVAYRVRAYCSGLGYGPWVDAGTLAIDAPAPVLDVERGSGFDNEVAMGDLSMRFDISPYWIPECYPNDGIGGRWEIWRAPYYGGADACDMSAAVLLATLPFTADVVSSGWLASPSTSQIYAYRIRFAVTDSTGVTRYGEFSEDHESYRTGFYK